MIRRNREEIISEYIVNKDVLDIGSIGQTNDYSLLSAPT